MIYRLVIDTNIFISAVFRDRTPEQVLRVIQAGEAITLSTPDIAAEVNRVLHYPKFRKYYLEIGRTPDELYQDYLSHTEMVMPSTDLDTGDLRDPKDAIILACAVGGKANMIISGDQDLITLGSYQDIAILTPFQFIELVNDRRDNPGGS